MTPEEYFNGGRYPHKWSNFGNEFGAFLSGVPIIGPMFGNLQNYQNQQSQLAYTKWAQQMTWDREDNAVQRRVADLEAAGLSPTLAAGSAAQTMAPVRTEAPQLDTGIGNQILGALQGLASLKQADANLRLTQLQERKMEQEIEYRSEMNPLKINEQALENEFKSETMQDRIKTVAAKKSVAELQDENIKADTALKNANVTRSDSETALNVVRGIMYSNFSAEASARRETFDRNRLTVEQQKEMIAAEIEVKKQLANQYAANAEAIDKRTEDEERLRDLRKQGLGF